MRPIVFVSDNQFSFFLCFFGSNNWQTRGSLKQTDTQSPFVQASLQASHRSALLGSLTAVKLAAKAKLEQDCFLFRFSLDSAGDLFTVGDSPSKWGLILPLTLPLNLAVMQGQVPL